MKRLIVCSLPLIALILSSCITRITPYEVDRVDQELKGNRGVIRGEGSNPPEAKRKKTRTAYDIEIELGSFGDSKKASEDSDKEIKGNKGYIGNKKVLGGAAPAPVKKRGSSRLGGVSSKMVPQVVYDRPVASQEENKKQKGEGAIVDKKTETYVVQKDDTLQKISEKVYGTTKKWQKIYEANKDTLKSPDMIRAGQKLVIPAE